VVPLDPRNEAGLDGIWEDEDWGRVGAELTWVGRQRLEDDPYRTWSPDYALVNVLAEVRVGRERLFLVARNLGDVRQTGWDPLLLPARAPDGRWTTDQWAPLEGRVVSAGVRLAF
jgi:iron complex outermembrane receptor protein